MPRYTHYIARGTDPAGDKVERTSDNLESMMAAARGWSKKSWTDVAVYRVHNEMEDTVATYEAGKVKKVAGGKPGDSIIADFQQKSGNNRDKLLRMLVRHIGKPVASAKIEEAVYGEANKSTHGAIGMVLLGLRGAIIDYNLPYNIQRQVIDGESTIGLFHGRIKEAAKPAAAAKGKGKPAAKGKAAAKPAKGKAKPSAAKKPKSAPAADEGNEGAAE